MKFSRCVERVHHRKAPVAFHKEGKGEISLLSWRAASARVSDHHENNPSYDKTCCWTPRYTASTCKTPKWLNIISQKGSKLMRWSQRQEMYSVTTSVFEYAFSYNYLHWHSAAHCSQCWATFQKRILMCTVDTIVLHVHVNHKINLMYVEYKPQDGGSNLKTESLQKGRSYNFWTRGT